MSTPPRFSPKRAPSRLARAVAFAALVVSAAACEGDGPRIYTAQPFYPDPESPCLGDYEPIGLVTAEDLPGTCDPVCLRLDDVLYLSTVCKPYPDTIVEETPDESEDCAAALASLEAEAYCE